MPYRDAYRHVDFMGVQVAGGRAADDRVHAGASLQTCLMCVCVDSLDLATMWLPAAAA